MRGYDLVLTYNWGAMDAVMAHTLFADVYKLPPLVHHEDGFNEDEAERPQAAAQLYRRIALGRGAALVVPSRTLERIALERLAAAAQPGAPHRQRHRHRRAMPASPSPMPCPA